MAWTLAMHVVGGDAAQLVINDWNQPVERGLVPSTPLRKQTGNLARLRHRRIRTDQPLFWARIAHRGRDVRTNYSQESTIRWQLSRNSIARIGMPFGPGEAN